MLTLPEIRAIASRSTYLDWTLYVGPDGSFATGRPYLQWQFEAEDTDRPGVWELQKCRKWYLSYHMTHQEIERTAFKALEAAVFHEMCENYRYRSKQIRHPHLDPDVLAGLWMGSFSPVISREGE